jgi:hypothetical protein
MHSDAFFLIIKHCKWKNGYLQQYCDYWREYLIINWQYTDFKDENDFNKWRTKHENL